MESVFKQEYQPVEIIVVDDGSSDNTPELIKSYGKRVRYYRQENCGVASARTKGCQLAKGELIAFHDDDDFMLPKRIIHLMDSFRQFPHIVLSLGDWAVTDSNGNLTGKKSNFILCRESKEPINSPIVIQDGYTAILWSKLTPLPQTTLFRKKDAEFINWFDPKFFHACSDTDFFARLGVLGPIVYVPQIVAHYRLGHNSIWDKKFLAEYSRFLLIEKHLSGLNPKKKELKKRLQTRMRSTLNQLAKLKSKGIELPDSVSSDYVCRGLKHLELKDRLSYFWSIFIKLPISNKIKKNN
jgi:glycosyltransferase involved in cell wall biosynthesis